MIEENQQEYTFEYSNKYQLHIELHKKSGQKKIIDKIATFLHELSIHPTTGTGQVESLKGYGERNVYSRRIDKKHRLTYEVFEEEKRVEILSAYGITMINNLKSAYKFYISIKFSVLRFFWKKPQNRNLFFFSIHFPLLIHIFCFGNFLKKSPVRL